jgi:hypothetical protein
MERTSRREFLVRSSLAVPLAAAAPGDIFAAATEATIVLHDARIAMPDAVAQRLREQGARLVTLELDPVRQWRDGLGELFQHADSRLLGVTRWADYLMLRGLAAESRRHVRYERLNSAGDAFVWMIS